MKKNFPTLLLLIAFVISITSCQSNNQTMPLTPEEIATNWNNTNGKISHEEANQLEENYKKYLYEGSRDSLLSVNDEVYADTREVHFDIEDLKNYIHYVEQYGKDKNYNNLGIRVYLGSKGPQKDGKAVTTVFFYGTGTKADGGNQQKNGDEESDPNLPGADGLNLGSSGMPPKDLLFP
jgi:hypothetical protein